MDDRDAALIAQLEQDSVDSVSLLQLIGILSSRRLGPDTIDGVPVIDIRQDNPKFVALMTHIESLQRRAFKHIKASQWYSGDRWPDPPRDAESALRLPPGSLGFRQWVDHRMEDMDEIDAIKHGREA